MLSVQMEKSAVKLVRFGEKASTSCIHVLVQSGVPTVKNVTVPGVKGIMKFIEYIPEGSVRVESEKGRFQPRLSGYTAAATM